MRSSNFYAPDPYNQNGDILKIGKLFYDFTIPTHKYFIASIKLILQLIAIVDFIVVFVGF